MIASEFRFHGRGGLRFLHKNAQSYRSRYFIFKVIPIRNRSYSRFAVIVSKKVHKSAVGRNRIRRRVYELIRTKLHDLPMSYDVAVMVVSGEVIQADYRDLEKAFIESCSAVGLTPSPTEA